MKKRKISRLLLSNISSYDIITCGNTGGPLLQISKMNVYDGGR
ncbi:hypothetical protein SAMN02745912_01759 [Paramaledivibacter caminithermalis DSM 15212]|jgi:hypothetical protein|uniref:Uncharacterized protein n=1 Tax=Paramaledivibacter caminithermalis (strain DSM 15212 / CIP 107654 / DViRD3) TaxID=1121301 RepID=A0A1M6NJS9_PARC5|nr:hypothetical protein SAMN02745912_01759 [Paramaledivibacter caminithermalis DSM 15212]